MPKIILLFLLAFGAFANVFAQNTGDNVSKAKAFIDLLVKKDFQTAETYFSDELKAQFSAEQLAQAWNSLPAQVGNFKNQANAKSQKIKDYEIVVITTEFEKASLNLQMSFNAKGEIGGFFVKPATAAGKSAETYAAPEYVRQDLFQEREVTVGAGEWTLPATLTMPNGKINVPVVVLVHGSGANDRDETHVNPANKPFKDLAWGLASRGIAVLRYEKRSKQYAEKFAVIKRRTVDDETTNDALAAVQLLRQTPNIDAKNIYVLGHSLGGMMIPRIGARDSRIAGLIVLAGTTRPLEDVIGEQYNYLFSIDGTISPEEQKFLEAAKKGIAEVKAVSAKDADSGRVIIGFPAAYWLDWKTYNPPLIAKTLPQPMLILQGERDYQVTMSDFQNWKDALGTKKSIALKTYANLNHLFMPVEGAPNPDEYQKTNHVLPDVINDIAAWILKAKK